MQQPKPKVKVQPKAPAGPKPTREDIELSKRSGISIEEIMAQGGATPRSVMDEIQKTGAYTVKYGPGLYKKPAKKVVPKKK